MKVTIAFLFSLLVACCASSSGTGPQAPASAAATASSTSPTRPQSAAAVKHLREHVNYPASRAAVLAACAQTPEFTADEKKWLSDNLPERTYASADEVAAALRL